MPTPMEDDDYDESGVAPAAAPAASSVMVAALDAAAKSVARGDEIRGSGSFTEYLQIFSLNAPVLFTYW